MLKNSVNHIYEVYRERSFSKAAQKLFVSQSALSASIQKEEAAWGCPFFDRSTNPVQLTAEGKLFIAAVERMKEVQCELEEALAAQAQERQHTLDIGAPSFFCTYILPPVIQQLQSSRPDCRINVIEASDDDLLECLQSDAIDLCLTVQSWPGSMFRSATIGQEEVILAVPARFPVNEALTACQLGPEDLQNASRLREGCPRVPIGAFQDLPFLLLKRGNDMHSRALKICKQGGFLPEIRMTLTQLLTSYHMAAAGMGAAFIRAGLMRYAGGGVCCYALDSGSTLRQIQLVCKKNRALPAVAQELSAALSSALL